MATPPEEKIKRVMDAIEGQLGVLATIRMVGGPHEGAAIEMVQINLRAAAICAIAEVENGQPKVFN